MVTYADRGAERVPDVGADLDRMWASAFTICAACLEGHACAGVAAFLLPGHDTTIRGGRCDRGRGPAGGASVPGEENFLEYLYVAYCRSKGVTHYVEPKGAVLARGVYTGRGADGSDFATWGVGGGVGDHFEYTLK